MNRNGRQTISASDAATARIPPKITQVDVVISMAFSSVEFFMVGFRFCVVFVASISQQETLPRSITDLKKFQNAGLEVLSAEIGQSSGAERER